MAENIQMRLNVAARKAGIGIPTIIEYLASQGDKVDNNPNTKLSFAQLESLAKKFNKPELLSEPAPAPAPAAPISTPTNTPSTEPEILYFRDTPAPKPAEVKPEPVAVPTPAPAPPEAPAPEVVAEPVSAPVVSTPVIEVKQEVEQPEPPIVEEVPQSVGGVTILGKIDLSTRQAAPKPKPPQEHRRPARQETASAKAPEAPRSPKPQEAARPAEPARKPEPVKPPAKAPVVEPTPAPAPEPPKEVELIKARGEKLQGLTVLGKIQLPTEADRSGGDKKKRKRKRVKRTEKVDEQAAKTPATTDKKEAPKTGAGGRPQDQNRGGKNAKGKPTGNRKDAISDSDVKDSMKQTMARMSNRSGVDFGAKYRKEKRRSRAEQEELQHLQDQEGSSILRVTEFISAAELASLMDVSVNEVIGTCMQMGMFVSINQRLDAEAIQMIALEFGFDVEFISAEEEVMADNLDIEDDPNDLVHRAPIVTIMGHVDHGKTSLLDFIRRSKVAAGEAGGITQHIGAYSVKVKEGANKGKMITFLDTPGHEAFTAMRARGAKVTDVAIIVVAADDSVMPQTREAINHALNAGVPIVFAINKIDKPAANPQKIREDLAKENILVESWGGKYQEQEVSAKQGIGIDELLDKVLLEAEMLELRSNPDRRADGTIIEASLDKGRGYVTTVLVQNGTLKVGDILLAGPFHGRVRAMIDDMGQRIKEAGPSTPVQLLGLPGAPQAGDRINVMETEREAREIANKREQILREQSIRAKKHITLDEIGRRKAIGSFQELNVIVKGDVDGSVEALADSLLKISTDEVQVRIIHKGVGQISESDILLASAADAIVIGFQVRPSMNARKVAEQEEIEIRLYSVIYDAINELKDALEGMLAPKEEEVIVGNIEVREIFKISKIGTIAGCYVLDGYVKRNNRIRIIRDGIVSHEGEISALKRFKDDVQEVRAGYECGLSIKNFNDIQVGDIIESYEIREIKRKL